MFLRVILFVMICSVVFARNLEHDDDRVASAGVPCSKEETLHHHQRDVKQADTLNDNNAASSMIIPAKNNDEHPYPLKMHLKKRAAAAHESHTPEPKPGCCG